MVLDLTQRLHKEIAKMADIVGVSVGKWNDKSTWRVHYSGEPTQEQLNAIARIIEQFDVGYVEEPISKIRHDAIMFLLKSALISEADVAMRDELLAKLDIRE